LVNFISIDEAAKALHLTKSYVYKLVHLRKIPCFKPGNGRILFDPTELDEWIRRGRIATGAEISDQAEAFLMGRRR